MTRYRFRLLSAALVATTLMTAQLPVFAQTTDSTTAMTMTAKKTRHKAKEHKETAAEIQMRELKESVQAQQDQIDALKAQVAAKSSDAATAQQTAADAQTQAAAAAASAAQAQAAASAASSKADAISSSVTTSLQTTTAEIKDSVAVEQKKIEDEVESPAALHYKGVNITPGGFVAFEGVWRQHSVNSDINTPLNSIPFPSANEGHTSELNFSGRQSRLSALVTGDAGSFKLTGYYEMDFLGTGTSSNNNQSNSYVLRQRQIWGQAAMQGGFTITGGQMWSLVTEDAKGTDARTEIQPLTIDPQYLVGYSWTRQPGIRIQQRFGDYKTGAFTIAVAAEQAQITNFTASGMIPTDFYFGGIGQNGGLYNAAGNIGALDTAGTAGITTYANNVAPDVIVKAAFDEPWLHFEVGGIGRFLRNEFFPVLTTFFPTATPTTEAYTYGTNLESNTAKAGGVFGSIRVKPTSLFEVAVQAMAGQGVGRYGSAQLADATLRPNETLEPIRNYHGLFSFVAHPTKKLDAYVYYGGEYAQRTVYTTGLGELIGYGPRNLSDAGCYNEPAPGGNSTGAAGTISAATCGSPTRYISEAMGGLTYRAIDSPKYGRLQYQLTYSYIQRNLWSGVGSASTPTGPRATEPMIHISMRYYIP
jgi:hypothetical protein